MSYRIIIILPWLLCLSAGLSGACGPRQDASSAAAPGPVGVSSARCHAPAAGPNVRITNAVEESIGPVISWNGAAFDLAWRDMRGRHPTVFVAQVDRAGTIVAEEQRILGDAAARDHSIANDESEGHVVFLEQGRARSVRLRSEPEGPVTVDEEVSFPTAGPLGAVAWVKKGNLLFRTDFPPAATSIHQRVEEARFTRLAQGGIFDVAMAWNGGSFAVVWSELAGGSRKVMLQRVDNRGGKIGPSVQVSAAGGLHRQPVAAWSDGEWAVGWISESRVPGREEPRLRVFMALVPERAGGPQTTRELDLEVAVDRVALAATGDGFGLAWVGNLEPTGSAVFFQGLDRDGNPRGSPLRVSDDKPLGCGRPALAWAGDGFGVVWHDDREPAGSEIFFSFVACGEEPPAADAGLDDDPDAGPARDDAVDEAEHDRPLPELYTEEGEKGGA